MNVMGVVNLKVQGLVEILLSYKELCYEIEYFELLLEEAEREWKNDRRIMIGESGKTTIYTVDRIAENMDKITDRHNKYEKLISIKKRLKFQAEEIMRKFDGIEYRVAYKRFVEKKKLEEIAEELHYSIDGIKKISSRITKALDGH